jgi:hypothetical protein
MPHFSKRLQVLLTPEQYVALEVAAKRHHQPVGAAIRDAIERQIIEQERGSKRKQAAACLCALNLPTLDDWSAWKRQYEATKASCGASPEPLPGT